MNQHVHDIFDVKKVQSKAGGLYDVTNGLFIDFADRYYGSAEIISHLEFLKYNYVIRGKSNFYKKQVALIQSDDE